MNRLTLGLVALVVVIVAAGFAAAPWEVLSATDGYSESLGIALFHSDREPLDASNCYDVCAAIWGRRVNDTAAAPRAGEP
jgi:predicted lipoprotein with Yx(FWY)xxD motif